MTVPEPEVAVTVVLDGSIAMRGAATVLAEAGLGVVRQCAGTDQSLAAAPDEGEARRDVVVVNLGDRDGRWTPHRIRPLAARRRVVAFCPWLGRTDIADLLHAGVRGAVPWDAAATTLVDAVRTVATHGFYVPRPSAVRAEPAERAGLRSASQVLTLREREVLQSVSTGLTHKEIARVLGLSKTTVDTYVQRIRQKLGVGNKAELARAAYRFGLCADE